MGTQPRMPGLRRGPDPPLVEQAHGTGDEDGQGGAAPETDRGAGPLARILPARVRPEPDRPVIDD